MDLQDQLIESSNRRGKSAGKFSIASVALHGLIVAFILFMSATATHNLVEYRDPISGALVFGAGSIDWSWGLAADHDSPGPSADPNIQQAMVMNSSASSIACAIFGAPVTVIDAP